MIDMKYFRTILILLVLIIFRAPSPAQDTLTRTWFPDPEVSFDTPTLSLPAGMADFARIEAWLEGRAAKDGHMTLEKVPAPVSSGYLPLVRFSEGTEGRKLKVWFQGAIHGNEPASAEGLFALMDALREDPSVLRIADIYILPIANMDGYLAGKRVSGSGYDLNRDQTKFADPVSVLLKGLFFRVSPDIAIDFHEYNPVRKELTEKGLTSYYDVLFLPTGHPAVPSALRQAVLDHLVAPARKALDGIGYSHYNYFTLNSDGPELALVMGARSPQSSSTSYSLSGAVSMLVEIRGIGLGRTALARRTNATLTVAQSILREIADSPEAFRKVAGKARREVLRGRTPVEAAFHSREVRRDVTFLSTETRQKQVLEGLLVRDALQPVADLVRPRPAAYVVEASQSKAIENLRTLGLELEILTEPREMTVGSYQVTEYAEDPVLWEKIRRQTVRTHLFRQTVRFEAGSAIVRVRQPHGAYAVAVLEPETENGFVHFRVIETALGDVLPVHRLMK
ncbi:MAG: succinylglutamate desuccinylase/aspartoacylase family protein [Bacteroidales bacterium]|nr:succinylglutamate desuccinylase/aspartoacylase family protein [Bacteroidales bacterium]